MIFAKNFARNYQKKILGTSGGWSMSHLSQPTSVLYCRLSDFKYQTGRKMVYVYETHRRS